MPSKSSDLMICLKELVKFKYRIYSPNKVHVRSVSSIVTKQLTLVKEEKQKIGPLVAKVPNVIEISIKCTGYCPTDWASARSFEKRYTFQYMIDDCYDCPVGSNTLTDKLKENNIKKFTEILDEIKEKSFPTDSSDEIEDFSSSSSSSMIIKCLKKLAEYKFEKDPSKGTERSEDFLRLLFDLGRLTLSTEEKQEIGPLVSEVLDVIRSNILWNINEWKICRRDYRISKASAAGKKKALQYLIDHFSDCPVESTTLAAKFKEFKVEHYIKWLDEIISKEVNQPNDFHDYISDFFVWLDSDYEYDSDSN